MKSPVLTILDVCYQADDKFPASVLRAVKFHAEFGPELIKSMLLDCHGWIEPDTLIEIDQLNSNTISVYIASDACSYGCVRHVFIRQ